MSSKMKIAIVVLVIAIVAGAVYYYKVYKPKQDAKPVDAAKAPTALPKPAVVSSTSAIA